MIEEIKYVTCPFCADGYNMEMVCYGGPPIEKYITCEECDATGEIEESDYIIMKLSDSI